MNPSCRVAYETLLPPGVPASNFGPESVNRTRGLSLIRTALYQLSYLRMEPRQGIEPYCHPYRGCGSPQSLHGWSPAGDLNSALSVTSAAHRHLCLLGLEPGGMLKIPQLTYRASGLSLNLSRRKFWSGVRESNPASWFGRPGPKALGQPRLIKRLPFSKIHATEMVRVGGHDPPASGSRNQRSTN